MSRKPFGLTAINDNAPFFLLSAKLIRCECRRFGQCSKKRWAFRIHFSHPGPIGRHTGKMFQIQTLFAEMVFVVHAGQKRIHPAFISDRRGQPAPDIPPTQRATHMRRIDFHKIRKRKNFFLEHFAHDLRVMSRSTGSFPRERSVTRTLKCSGVCPGVCRM